jgi:hypothetical protein
MWYFIFFDNLENLKYFYPPAMIDTVQLP